ncbi:Heavy-metal-associated domain protein [Posidoniimonas corsicana]|uniref:Heavy-metal-associated domain protein n=1 Tax=Posidoniimonas corsicana TaxID=1938618 RepID=A0A5C5V666_9BACT|nr:heavy metal-associated domain-containing protein [Posidoniimonas corsicana]TWT33443.1 Heavy-metal-associated domain protein [Posidoniimonas corsicana]
MMRTTAAALMLSLLVGCSESPTGAVDKTQVISSSTLQDVDFNTEGLPTVAFTVPSMHCEVMCTPKVRETLAKQPGVKDVRVDLESKTAEVAVEKEGLFDPSKAIEALEMADFTDVTLKADAT